MPEQEAESYEKGVVYGRKEAQQALEVIAQRATPIPQMQLPIGFGRIVTPPPEDSATPSPQNFAAHFRAVGLSRVPSPALSVEITEEEANLFRGEEEILSPDEEEVPVPPLILEVEVMESADEEVVAIGEGVEEIGEALVIVEEEET